MELIGRIDKFDVVGIGPRALRAGVNERVRIELPTPLAPGFVELEFVGFDVGLARPGCILVDEPVMLAALLGSCIRSLVPLARAPGLPWTVDLICGLVEIGKEPIDMGAL